MRSQMMGFYDLDGYDDGGPPTTIIGIKNIDKDDDDDDDDGSGNFVLHCCNITGSLWC